MAIAIIGDIAQLVAARCHWRFHLEGISLHGAVIHVENEFPGLRAGLCDGDAVLLAHHIPATDLPSDGKHLSGAHLVRRLDGDFGRERGQFESDLHRLIPDGERSLRHGLVGGAHHLDTALPGQQIAREAVFLRLGIDQGAALMLEGPDQLIPDGPAGSLFDSGKRHAHRRRLGHHLERGGQLLGAGGGAEGAAGGLGEALKLGAVLRLGHVKADHMGGEADAGFFKLPPHFAGIELAGFAPVGNQDHRGGFLGVFQILRRPDDGGGKRGLALRPDRLHGSGDPVAVAGAGRDQGFDIGAIALAPVAIDGEPDLLIPGQALQEIADHLLGDGDLGLAVDLPPHGARGVEHENRPRALRLLGRGGEGEHGQEKGCEECLEEGFNRACHYCLRNQMHYLSG